MNNKLEKRYGLPTAISMVVGIVIGSGVFFKAETVLDKTGGNMPLGIIAWLIVGAIMIVSSYVFAKIANRYEGANGLVDYAEAMLGKRYAYNIGWFMNVIYIPSLTAVLTWVSARYISALLGWDVTGGSCMTVALFIMCADYAINALAPKLSGKIQVSATFIKMIPLFLMALFGTIAGLTNGNFANEFAHSASNVNAFEAVMSAVISVAFAFDGWILATSINGELKNPKKNLPLALIAGALVVVATYVLYYIGINGAVASNQLLGSGEAGVKMAFSSLFGSAAGTIVFILIVISCLGTLNGLMIACCRGLYSLANRNEGPAPEMFRQVDAYTNMPTNSSIAGLAIAAFWLLFFYGSVLGGGWFGNFSFDNSELSIVTIYIMYIPIFIQFMRISKELNFFTRFIVPLLAVAGCCLMIYSAITAYGLVTVAHYAIIFVIIMIIGNIYYKKR